MKQIAIIITLALISVASNAQRYGFKHSISKRKYRNVCGYRHTGNNAKSKSVSVYNQSLGKSHNDYSLNI